VTYIVTVRDGGHPTERRVEAISPGFAAWVALGALVLGDRAGNVDRETLDIEVRQAD
jgi:hypothetical protein